MGEKPSLERGVLVRLNINIPNHIGIIPDGNRRWAKRNKVSYIEAYFKGYEVLRFILRKLLKLGVKFVSVYVMSRDNCLKRSKMELDILNELVLRGFKELREDPMVNDNKVSIKVIGDLSLVRENVRHEAKKTIDATRSYKEKALYLALCYGVKWEIKEAVKKGQLPPSLLMPPIDLIIRTGGRKRLSDFLPIPSSYAELYFTDVLWPDFNEEELIKAIKWFSSQERLFGK